MSQIRKGYWLLSICMGMLLTGCIDLMPGSSQQQTQSIRVQSAMLNFPPCQAKTYFLVLDVDALNTQVYHPCASNHYSEPEHNRNTLNKKGAGDDQVKQREREEEEGEEDGKDKSKEEGKDHGAGSPQSHENCSGDFANHFGDDFNRQENRCVPTANQGKCDSSGIGYRRTLKFFEQHVGEEITLNGGTQGDEAWFAPTFIRASWKRAGPETGDGLRNYLDAGPGLGRPDTNGQSESLLEMVPRLIPLRATGLARLEGNTVCAVVLAGEAGMDYATRHGNLQGPTLGKVAFQVLQTQNPSNHSGSRASSLTLPSVQIRILDAGAVCAEPLATFTNAPTPLSRCEPRDIGRPACSVQEFLVNEPWNSFDASRWVGDGDQMVAGGLFFAQPGAFSAAADWISPCPIAVDSTSAIRFSNRLQFKSTQQSDIAESGALFMVNADNDGSYNNYLFINVGYTLAPSKVFVEMFGSTGGVDFDQFEETSVPYLPNQTFDLDLWALPNAFQIAVAGEMVDTVALATPLDYLSLFEVGVQQREGGLRGLIDSTAITKLCQKEMPRKIRPHGKHRNRQRERVSQRCHTRNSYIRIARLRLKRCAHPSLGTQILAKMKEKPEFD